MSVQHPGNHLLQALPAAEFEVLRPHLEIVELVRETVLVEAGNPLTHVYLPHSGVISMLVRLSKGQTVEVAMVGHDSVFGASAALDGGMSLTAAVRLSAGHSLHSRYCGVSGDCRSQRCPSGPAGAP